MTTQAPTRHLPAALDPARKPDGTFKRGASGNPGGRPGRVLAKIREYAGGDLAVDDILLQRAAEAAGCRVNQIPAENRQSPLDLWIWVMMIRAAAGDIEFIREFFDRLAPKPRRMEIDARLSTARTVAASASEDEEVRREADEYYDGLSPPVDAEV